MKQNLIDSARFVVRAGDGGNGIVHFRREKYVPKGGPDGGDGGAGGSIYIVADENIKTLRYFAGKDRFEASRGGHGGKRQRHGKDAEDVKLMVPVGTVVKTKSQKPKTKSISQKDKVSEEFLEVADLDEAGMRVCVARGGRGGRGNAAFKSPTNTTPREAEDGEPGELAEISLELKVLADIGLVGLPNAGKSTLLSVLTAAKPEVADYPFTTLSPNLGVMISQKVKAKSQKHKSKVKSSQNDLIIADIPGLIEDAHKGKGLGIDFLKHVERCQALVYVLAPTINDQQLTGNKLAKELSEQFEVVRKEVEEYGHRLKDKPELVVVNKLDLISEQRDTIDEYFKNREVEVLLVSAATTEGVEELKTKLFGLVSGV